MALLKVRDVTLRFGGIVDLDGVSFAVEKGQISGSIGPNGAGKTTAQAGDPLKPASLDRGLAVFAHFIRGFRVSHAVGVDRRGVSSGSTTAGPELSVCFPS